MKHYIFTLFVRFFVAFSGLIVFIVSSKLYGAEGRGIIGYGVSIVSFFGLLLSLNLGRSFLFASKRDENLKKKLLPNFLAINYILIVAGACTSAIFWFYSSNANSLVDFQTMLGFLILMPYYVWSVNGSSIYAALNKTTKQDIVILLTRIVLIIVILSIFLLNVQSIEVFLYLYALTLCIGVIAEVLLLGSPWKSFSEVRNISRYISESKYVHIDYLAFNLYPLFLIITSSFFLKLSDLGKLNFLIQLINFIFILAVVASIRMKSYVATNGLFRHIASIKKLMFFTFLLSIISIATIANFLRTNFFNEHFPTFNELALLFVMLSFAIPGYIAYQFMYPVLIEYNQINQSLKINLLILIILVSLTYPILNLYGLVGSIILFSLFYLLVFLGQFYLYKRLRLVLFKN